MPETFIPASIIDAATIDLTLARNRLLETLAEEARFRLAIHQATGDSSLASQGSSWATAVAAIDPMAPGAGLTTHAALCEELSKRLHGEDICITEELYRLMTKEPGLPAWTHRRPDGGLFYVAKGWAIAEATGISLDPLICDPFLEAL